MNRKVSSTQGTTISSKKNEHIQDIGDSEFFQ